MGDEDLARGGNRRRLKAPEMRDPCCPTQQCDKASWILRVCTVPFTASLTKLHLSGKSVQAPGCARHAGRPNDDRKREIRLNERAIASRWHADF